MRSNSLSYMPALDGARAVAVALVFARHGFPESTFPGGLGVDVFFVISGFLITRILLREYDRDGTIHLRQFYVKRLLRLYPALLLVVVVFVALWWLVSGSLRNNLLQSAVAVSYTSNIFVTLRESGLGHLGHTWSLAMEEQFYLVWPPILLLLLRRRMRRQTIVLILAIAATASLAGWILTGNDYPYNPLTKAGALIIGCIAALMVAKKPAQNTLLAYLGLAVITLAFIAESTGLLQRTWTMPLVILGVVPVILHLSFGRGIMVRGLSARWIAYLGVISYGLYLWHYPIMWALRYSSTLPDFAVTAIALVLTFAAAALSFHFVERPALRLKERIGLNGRPSK